MAENENENTNGNGNYTPITDAYQYLDALLKTTLGVEGLATWAHDLYSRGATVEEIVQSLRYGLDESPAGQAAYRKYLDAYPGMDEFLRENVFPGAAPELAYLEYRNSVREAAARYGVSENLVNNEKVYSFIKNRISASEIAERMSTAAAAIATTPVETLAVLNEYYGVGSSDLLDFYLDTNETEAMLQKRYTAARIGTEAVRQQFGVTAAEAESLAERGVSLSEAQQGFQEIASRKAFLAAGGEAATREELIGASFGDQAAAEKVARVAASRAGQFAGGGAFAAGETGVSGLGAATR